MIKDITEVFNNFKIRDQDELEFAAYKVTEISIHCSYL